MAFKKKINDKVRKEISIALGQGISRSQIAKKYNVAYNTVKRIEQDALDGNGMAKVYNESAKIADQSTKNLLDLITSVQPYNIVRKIINILDDEDLLKKEIKQRGLNGANNIIKNLLDMAIKLERLKLDKEKQKFDQTHNIEIENNIGQILRLLDSAEQVDIDIDKEIEEFSND